MKNYYEILEVSQNASPEVIEKAYKTLVKKYHPDLQTKENYLFFENKMKEITEAYKVLSDTNSKYEYDLKFKLYNKDSFATSFENKQNSPAHNVIKKSQETNNSNKKIFGIKKYISAIGQTIYNETKKDKQERTRDIIAIVVTLFFVAMIVYICWKVPFLNSFFTGGN